MIYEDIFKPLQNPADRQAVKNSAKFWKTWAGASKGTLLMVNMTLAVIEMIEQQEAPSTLKVGVHGRNSADWPDIDFKLIGDAKLDVVKMMSDAHLGVFERLRKMYPNLLIITRLYDSHLQNTYFNQHKRPTPEEFAVVMGIRMRDIRAACECTMFEIHNEPNHPNKYEGWGDSREDAKSFNAWYLDVFNRLKAFAPWAQLGFPGLAIPHNDLEWIDVCKPAIGRSDWLGVHCYWETPEYEPRNHLSRLWGLRFIDYHNKFPDKDIHITECGNSSANRIGERALANQYVEYVHEVAEHDYVKSAAFFIMSSPDKTWEPFAWRKEDGNYKSVVKAIAERG